MAGTAEQKGGQTLKVGADILRGIRESGVLWNTVTQLFQGGVRREHLVEVIELRETLTKRGDHLKVIATPTVAQMIEAYHATDRDIDRLELLVDRASDLIELELNNIAGHKPGSSPGVTITRQDEAAAIYRGLDRAIRIASGLERDPDDAVDFEQFE